MAGRRQRKLTPPAPPRGAPATRGFSFSDDVDASTFDGRDLEIATGLPVPRQYSPLERLLAPASGTAGRGMGRTFRPMDDLDPVLRPRVRPIWERSGRRLSRPAVLPARLRAVLLAQGVRVGRLLQNQRPSVSLGQLDRRSRVCVNRRVRRGVLFSLRVAGSRTRSAGRGGTYRRSVDSAFSCR